MESVPGICEVVGGAGAEFLIEVPHGATREKHFDAVRGRLAGEYAAELKEFFFVNTDVGAPEVAAELARQLTEAGQAVCTLRGLVPRTFIDCNRDIDAGLRGDEMTPPVPGYVRHPGDIATLIGLYRRYRDVAGQAYERICGSGGRALMLHTYAPRSVRITRIGDDIVERLHEAYEPERYASWERRPEVDLISEDTAGKLLAPRGLVDRVRREYAAAGIEVAENATYRLHPETMGHVYSSAHPGRILCMEISRELLADPFTPFEEMHIAPDRVARMARPVARALGALD
jgi:hypothetical protein